mgnify:CR=1 FL=1
MSDIDFDELDRAVTSLMQKRAEKEAAQQTADTESGVVTSTTPVADSAKDTEDASSLAPISQSGQSAVSSSQPETASQAHTAGSAPALQSEPAIQNSSVISSPKPVQPSTPTPQPSLVQIKGYTLIIRVCGAEDVPPVT